MKNVRPNQIKTAIFLTVAEYENILKEIFGFNVIVHTDLDGLWYETGEILTEEVEITDEVGSDLFCKLATYFDIKEITSLHADDCIDEVGIWIIYKN